MCVCVCVCVTDVRWKNKFWGKSMEILPIGTVHVMLPRYSLVCFSAPFIHLASVFSSAWLSVSYFLHLSAVMVITMSGTRWRQCIHNILSGRRWIEHYGEVTIRNTRNINCICKLTFVKVHAHLQQHIYHKWVSPWFSTTRGALVLKGSYDAISSFAFSLECYKLIVQR